MTAAETLKGMTADVSCIEKDAVSPMDVVAFTRKGAQRRRKRKVEDSW